LASGIERKKMETTVNKDGSEWNPINKKMAQDDFETKQQHDDKSHLTDKKHKYKTRDVERIVELNGRVGIMLV